MTAIPGFVSFSFVTPTESYRLSYQNVKKKLSASLQENEHLRNGLLLESSEKGVYYPVVHCGPVQNYWEHQKLKENSATVTNDYRLEQGCYREMASVHADLFGDALDDFLSADDESNPSWRRFYILLGFKQNPTANFSETMEIHWKDWTGARYLFLNLPDEFGLSRLTFYKRLSPDNQNLFLYLVLVECIRVTPTDEVCLQDFIQRMRADKMPFYLALYEERENWFYGSKAYSYLRADRIVRHRSLSRSTGIGSLESFMSEENSFDNGTTSPTFSVQNSGSRSMPTFTKI